MATRSASLNPASLPFFPGSRQNGDDDGAGPFGNHALDRSSLSSVSVSPSEFRSAKSSPSPSQQALDGRQQSPPMPQFRESPTFRQVDNGRLYGQEGGRRVREGSMLSVLDTLQEADDTMPNPPSLGNGGISGTQTPNSSFYSLQQRNQITNSPIPANQSTQTLGTGSFKSISPVSSLDSGSQVHLGFDPQSFESQLKTSPVITEILDRLARSEAITLNIQREMGDLQVKVNFLVDHALSNMNQGQPEFKDPFSSNGSGSGAITPLSGFNPRPSMGNIAPNQIAPVDDMGNISQRLNVLTTSVGQLLAIQTQQLQNNGRSNSAVGLSTPPIEIAPNQAVNHGLLGHGLPNRPDLRPNQRAPLRTYSTGTLELPPVRPLDQGLQRPDALMGKRRGSGLMRRDSSGVIDPQGELTRDGPVVSKWEHLALAPELLRSLNKFGIGPPNKIQQRALPFLLRGSDIIAQAPPTQERIAAYVIPAIQVAISNIRTPNRGPLVIMVSTTVDQATQAQRMIRDIGGPIGVRSALGVGTTNASGDLSQEMRLLQQNMPHIICGTPQKLHSLFTSPGGLIGSEVRFLVLDEVDQLIARNLHEFVFNIVKLLPPPRSRAAGPTTPGVNGPTQSPFTSPFEPSNPVLNNLQQQNGGRRFSSMGPGGSPSPSDSIGPATPLAIERQTALFSNTVPQDVLNLASAINLREPVRVLVRRDGGVTNQEATQQNSRGLRQFYLYLAVGRSDNGATPGGSGGLGIIGSGRGSINPETNQAREWKLEALADMLDDIEINQAIVHVGSMPTLDAVVYKLASRGLEAIPFHNEMNPGTKLAALNKFRAPGPSMVTRPTLKVLVVYEVQIKSPDVSHVPLVINYDLPKAVEEYAHRVVPAVAPNYSRAGVVINYVTATGGDVEMLRSIECFYKIKCPEVPATLRDII
ncbi:hypothetical protein DFP72DRAFT_564006 [Ephemerocybe angulata]|uniref:RNA helicase n=1 Tax=Ephemerocybe angulata TaxID=980116 RepID=A0A8H6IBW5_9AGAR|nr:hypothetical protein DFP72DRAFT_564006 [Tulosesus angulatus]